MSFGFVAPMAVGAAEDVGVEEEDVVAEVSAEPSEVATVVAEQSVPQPAPPPPQPLTNPQAQVQQSPVVVAPVPQAAPQPTPKPTPQPTRPSTQPPKQETANTLHVGIHVQTPFGAAEYAVQVPAGSTVEQAMAAARAQGFSYTTRGFSSMGAYVDTINGLPEDTRAQMYWIYYVNGAKSFVGISSRPLEEGDVVKWNYEKAI